MVVVHYQVWSGAVLVAPVWVESSFSCCEGSFEMMISSCIDLYLLFEDLFVLNRIMNLINGMLLERFFRIYLGLNFRS